MIGILTVPVLIGIIILIIVHLARKRTRYTVTEKRIGIERGIFSKESKELRIQDVRSIVSKRNLLGYGHVEFSTSATDDAEIVFNWISHPEQVRDLVKRFQN